ncbi:uncharacterized protein sdt isoform X2 [Chelonus insularis]|uniref:uncharacterized protein sdt isoform X2 n=1 Tax=Chelonus insularis TaxID=460826 RepID=UPI00158D6028|nr:uncharacterized protein LOC118075148 isoform X2 [Chelonus insularis]
MVDLGGYIIILMNDNGKIKLYGSSADNADYPEVGDEILEVNGRTLENATDSEVSQHIHQCIKSGTISLQVTRRSGNKMKLDGPNADRIRDAWVIALERGARERLQKLPALKKIQPRDIQAILHQQINESSLASTSKSETPKKDITNGHITVTLDSSPQANRNNLPPKLSNGTVPKGVAIEETDVKDRKVVNEKQRNHLEEQKLLHPSQNNRLNERRTSSPFQNGRTEVLIGEPEGGPRSPRGSTSSAVNENFLSAPREVDNPEPICRSRRRSGSGVADIHLQQSQLQENNNGESREFKDSRESVVPNEMWVPGVTPGHHRELPVDVPDTLLQQAYANKVINDSSSHRYETARRNRSASHLDLSPPLSEYRQLSLNIKNESSNLKSRAYDHEKHDSITRTAAIKQQHPKVDRDDKLTKLTRIIEITVQNNNKVDENDLEKQQIQTKELLGESSDDEVDSSSPEVKESNVDVEDDYPFAKEDYPTMLKTCSDDSASPRSSSGRSDSTTALDASLIMPGKESPLYDATRIDLGSPCRPMPDISPLFGVTRETTSFDNPAYGLDLHDLHQGLLIRSDEIQDLRLIGDVGKNSRKNTRSHDSLTISPASPWSEEPHHVIRVGKPENVNKSAKKKEAGKNRDLEVDLIGAKSTDDLLAADLTTYVSRTTRSSKKKRKNQQTSSGYSTLRSDSSDLHSNRSFLVVGSNHSYREVAVDCPPDFVPVTKSHPIYPPPNKNDKRTPVETDYVGHKEERKETIKVINEDDAKNGIDNAPDNCGTLKVRSKVKSLLQHSGKSLSNTSPISSIISNSLSPLSPKKLNRTIFSRSSLPYVLQKDYKMSEPCIGLSFQRIYSFRDETNQNSKNLLKAFDDDNNNSDDDDNEYEKDIIYLDNKENSALYHAYESISPSTSYTSSFNSCSLRSHNSAQDTTASLTLNHQHTTDNTRDLVDNHSNGLEGDDCQGNLNGIKPAIPPRDQKRAPARPPKDNVRLSARNNNVELNDNTNTTIESQVVQQPTPQQLNSIKKYQEQLRQRKDHEERQEYLNQSLRGSRKLHALESHAINLSGQENPAYSQDEATPTPPTSKKGQTASGQASPRKEEETPVKVLSYGDVVATLERLQLQLKNLTGALGISGPGVEAELEAVRTLLLQRRFATALTTYNLVKTKLRSGKLPKHYDDDASNLARDCVEVLEDWQRTNVKSGETLAMVEELTGILTSYEVEGLLLAHDSIISYVDGIQRKEGPSSSSPSESPSLSSSFRDSKNTDNIKIIRIEKTNEPLGATVRNEGDAVIIGRVVRGGAAEKSGLFNEGDEVLEVNGVEMRGKSVNEVCDILAGMQGSLTFLVLPASSNNRGNNETRREENNQIHHVRAHFDYDPEEDPYIPCRELGISFQKGDVLHVISQDDSNWWQAYREGEEDQTLAGLIPSKAFQHQRESMKQTITGSKSSLRGSKKSSTLLCTRKNPKKKKKRSKFGPNLNEDYPHYSTTTIDDYDSEEVLTYEEVALYYPRASHKRPIVLIGPPNIGRHELRQRLMQDSERFAAAIPHTSRPRKGSEVDGQDYHFISRSQFESDILCRKFVEHGEYEKAYYGTSIEAIRTVVNSGKICVLNLHPQSLKILRSSDLKPYVVFVAPPSLEKLRQRRIKSNESFKEEELKDIIEKAREMEDKYGHLFDMIIINNDTDRAYNQLLTEINSLEREPQWVPISWIQ